jgi:glucoamylase
MDQPDLPLRIEDYALIGDGRTAALVGRNGAIDWLCLPRFDSAACFAALLGDSNNGSWRIAPASGDISGRRHYHDGGLVLETMFDSGDGGVALIDFMIPGATNSSVVRIVEGRRGQMRMAMRLALRFDYGVSVPWVTRLYAHDNGGLNGITAIAGPELVVLRTPVELHGHHLTTVAEFTVSEGERIPFVLSHGPSHLPPPDALDAFSALERTEDYWHGWSEQSRYRGPWKEAVDRSLITLKALAFEPTGGIVAAPTTSLPEKLGGKRNWDYRFCWLRDATLTLLALMEGGYYDEAKAWRDWLHRSLAGSPEQIQIMYGIAGERRLDEWEVPWLAGYHGAKPVRIGNAASGQLQLDVYGEVMDALHHAREGGLASVPASWSLQLGMMEHLEKIWREADEGIWEVRGGRQPFTYSKVMAWVAMDRAVRDMEKHKLHGPLERWRSLRQEIHDTVCREGFDSERNSFVQSFGSKELDASVLMIPLVGFLPPEDPRVRGTVDAIQRELTVDGLVLRYASEKAVDGLPPGESAFLACSFWMADNLKLLGRNDEAQALFERLLALRNDVGLLSEEYDPHARRFTGNFPQAFSHTALVGTAMHLSDHGPVKQRSSRQHQSGRTARGGGDSADGKPF